VLDNRCYRRMTVFIITILNPKNWHIFFDVSEKMIV